MRSWHLAAILAALVTAIAVVAGFLFFSFVDTNADAEGVAERFFEAVADARYDDAYRDTAPAFQQATPVPEFRAALDRVGLAAYRSAQWNDRTTARTRTTLRGTLALADGVQIPATLVLVRLGEAWRIHSLDMRGRGDSADAVHLGVARPPAPGAGEDAALAERTLLSFNDAVQRADFTQFHGSLARQFRQRYDPEEIQQSFQAFIDRDIDIAAIENFEPIFEERTAAQEAAESGRLRLKGRYPTRPSEVLFDLVYLWEEGAWRLIEISVRVQPAE